MSPVLSQIIQKRDKRPTWAQIHFFLNFISGFAFLGLNKITKALEIENSSFVAMSLHRFISHQFRHYLLPEITTSSFKSSISISSRARKIIKIVPHFSYDVRKVFCMLDHHWPSLCGDKNTKINGIPLEALITSPSPYSDQKFSHIFSQA